MLKYVTEACYAMFEVKTRILRSNLIKMFISGSQLDEIFFQRDPTGIVKLIFLV